MAIIHNNIDILEPITATISSKNPQHYTNTCANRHNTNCILPQKQPSTEIIEGITNRHDQTFITGDFNSKHEDFGRNTSDKCGRAPVHVANKYRSTKLNDSQQTYTNDYTGKQDVKDLIFSSPKMTATFKEFWIDEDLGSDHNTIIAIFSHEGITYNIPPTEIYLYDKPVWPKINKVIENNMINHQIKHKSTHEDINNYITELTNTITETINDNVKKIKIQPKKIGLPPFIRESIKEKRKVRSLYQRTITPHYKRQDNQLNNSIKVHIKTERKKNWETKCDDLELDERQDKTWNQLKQMMGLKPTKTKFPTLITKNRNNQTIKSTSTEDKIVTLTKTFKDMFTYGNTKPYFNESQKINVESDLKNT